MWYKVKVVGLIGWYKVNVVGRQHGGAAKIGVMLVKSASLTYAKVVLAWTISPLPGNDYYLTAYY